MIHLLKAPLLLSTVLVLGACHSTGPSGPYGQRVDASLLQYAAEADRDQVTEAKAAADRVADDVLVAQRKKTDAEGELAVANRQLDIARAELAKAKTQAKVDGDMVSNDADVRRSLDAVRGAEAEVAWRKSLVGVANHEVTLLDQKHDLAKAKIDLAAAKAVVAAKRTEGRGIDAETFERSVREKEADVKVAQVRLDESSREAKIQHEAAIEKNREAAKRDEAKGGG